LGQTAYHILIIPASVIGRNIVYGLQPMARAFCSRHLAGLSKVNAVDILLLGLIRSARTTVDKRTGRSVHIL